MKYQGYPPRPKRHYDPWFVAAWVGLVIVVAFGFFVQARTIDRLQRDEDLIAQLVHRTDAQQTKNAMGLCRLLLVVEPQDQALIVKAFADMGYDCTK